MREEPPTMLIDPPVTPFSPPEEIEAWIEECRRMQKERPDEPVWEDLLAEARRYLETSREIRQTLEDA